MLRWAYEGRGFDRRVVAVGMIDPAGRPPFLLDDKEGGKEASGALRESQPAYQARSALATYNRTVIGDFGFKSFSTALTHAGTPGLPERKLLSANELGVQPEVCVCEPSPAFVICGSPCKPSPALDFWP